jgi:hypothetical protein
MGEVIILAAYRTALAQVKRRNEERKLVSHWPLLLTFDGYVQISSMPDDKDCIYVVDSKGVVDTFFTSARTGPPCVLLPERPEP